MYIEKPPLDDDFLMHYGVAKRSGRYPWGSGDNPYQHSGDFLSRVQELKNQGLTETEIVKAMGLDSTTQLRVAYSKAKNERRQLQVDTAKSLQKDGLGATEIGRKMGLSESTVRSLLNEDSERRMNQTDAAADAIKKELKTKGIIDVGAGVEGELGISKTKLNDAIYSLEADGYIRTGIGLAQVTNKGKQTTMQIICDPSIVPEGTENPEKYIQRMVYNDPSLIKSFGDYHSTDGGFTFDKREYPSSISSDRIKIRYGDEGGLNKDGVIEIRRGVEDLSLGNSHYAQVRILVDGTHYLKGMALYSDDLPDGCDIVFNTNKKSGTPKMDVLKPIKNDPDNPFGAYIKAGGQSKYIGADGKEHLSAINKLKEEGDWDSMSRNLSSQFLSKQPLPLINKQLNLTYSDYVAKLDEINSLSNPTIKRKMLLDFANECDSAAVHLKAAALPRQQTRVILPITQLKENEVYAPYLKNGEKVCLVRYPHAGTFEVPTLTVNNRNKSAKDILGNPVDAIGINAKVAERLSGADFDGDQVIVIPVNNRVRISTQPYLKDLKGFEPKTEYSTEGKTGVRLMKKSEVGREMGIISNLITDMTLIGAPEEDLVKAVKHSMVVIDAEKHKLDYKRSEKENDIAELKKRYQKKYDADGNVIGYGGASTLISKRKQDYEVPETKGSGRIDPETGKVIYKESGRTYIDKKGNEVLAKKKIPIISAFDDAHVLSSGDPKEDAYADYSNKMKALANEARKTYLATDKLKYDPQAKKTYQAEVSRLNAALNVAKKNAPRERQAQAIATSVVKAKKQAYPELADKDHKKELKKIEQAALEDARVAVGASGKRSRIVISDKEWEAIQAGAITDSKLSEILRFTDADNLKQRALPRTTSTLSTAQANKMKSMKASGYTIAEIAEAIGVSTSTVSKHINS